MTSKIKTQNDIVAFGIKNLRELTKEKFSFQEFFVRMLEVMMMLEREDYLKELKDKDTLNDKGNGFYARLMKQLKSNNLIINIPRTRTGKFKPEAIEFMKIAEEERNNLCLELYKKGMTTREIEDIMKKFLGNKVSASSISKLAKEFKILREAWQNTPLEEEYLSVFFDVIFITVRRGNSYSKEGVFVAYGVRKDLKRELLILEVNPTEGANMWEELFIKLKERGVKKVGLFIGDGLKGMEDVILKIYPNSNFQKCVVHKMRNILSKTRPKDKEEMSLDLKNVFNNFNENASIEQAVTKVKAFISKWEPKYSQIGRFFQKDTIEYYFTYIKYPPETRRTIYTTNSIENLNKAIRKATKNKLSFESPESLLDYVFVVIKDFEEKNWMKYPITSLKNYIS